MTIRKPLISSSEVVNERRRWTQDWYTWISDLVLDLVGVETDVSTIQTDITTIQGDITTIQGDITTINGQITTINAALAGPSNQIGFSNGSNAPAGDVGEYLSSFVPFGSAITVPDSIDTQITSLSLTAGDWDLSGEVFIEVVAGDIDTFAYAINTAVIADIAHSLPVDGLDGGRLNVTGTGGTHVALPGLRTRVNITSTTSYLLVVFVANSTGSSQLVWGGLRARRMR